MYFQPFMQAGAQGPERDQYDGAAKAEVLIEGLIKQGTQQGATQAEYQQQYPEQEGGRLSFIHGISLSCDGALGGQ